MRLILVLSIAVLMAATVAAQQRTGSIVGVVQDGSGAIIAGASIAVRNLQTGMERNTTSNGDGVYLAAELPVGTYSVTARRDGFQPVTREGITVDVNRQSRADLSLPVAATEQVLTVVEDAPQVDTTDASLGVTVGSRQITALPLNGRNYTELGPLMPGVVGTPARYETQGLPAAGTAFSVNGQRIQSNNFLLDGVTNNDLIFSGYVLTPPPDSLAQFRILTNNYAAEYGQNSGSVVNAITRSGTNNFHGALWNFLRNDKLDARNFFATRRPPLRRNQFGGTVGGPVVRENLFFFGYYEGLREREGTVQNVVVLSEAERAGNLSGSTPASRDPLTGQPFPAGIIPADRIDPIANALLERFVPLPNQPGNRFNRAPSVATDADQFGGRGDVRISDENTLFVRYSYSASDVANPLGAGSFSPQGSSSVARNHNAVISDTHVFSPTLINEASVTFLRQFGRPATWSGIDAADFGFRFPGTEPSARGLPIVSLSGLFSVGDVAQSWTKLARNTYQAYDNLSWITGRHSLKAGFDSRMQQIFLVFPNRPNGDFSFTGAATGNTVADFLLGLPAQFRQGGGEPAKHFVGWQHAFYLQDDLRVTRRLTLNLGVRYDLPIPYYDKQNRVASFQPGRQSVVRPNAPANVLYPGDPGVTRSTVQTDTNNIAPRFGFAFDVFGNGRTAIRGGYGIVYDAVPGVAAFQNINVPPFNRFIQVDAPAGFANPYASLPVNPQTDPSREFPCPCLVIGFSPDFRTPYAQQFNFGVEQQLTRNLMLEVSYVGSLGRKLAGYLEVNPAVPGPGANRTNTQARRLHSDYNLVRPTFSRFSSSYHSMQTRLEKRFSSGLNFLASYTWSKAIDYQSSLNLSGENRPQDAFSLEDVRGLAAFDTRHRFVLSYGYELPFFRNRRSLAGFLFGGWNLQGILSAQSGNPLTVTEPIDRSLRGLGADRPDQVANPNNGPKTPEQWFETAAFLRLPDVSGGQRSGTAGRNTVIGPGFVQTDISAIKHFQMGEQHRIELRAEAFNAINRTNFYNPVTNIGSPAFGSIQTARAARIIQLALKYAF